MEIAEWDDRGLRARLGAQDMVDLAYGPGRVDAGRDGRTLVAAVVGLGRVEEYLDRLVRAAPETAPHRRAMESGFAILEVEPEVRAEVWLPWPVFEDLFRRGGESRTFSAPVRIRLRGYEFAWTSGWSARLDFPPRAKYAAAADLAERKK
ncbi:MAG: hypothetical protein QXO51_07780 [Halobacteria archaeon]